MIDSPAPVTKFRSRSRALLGIAMVSSALLAGCTVDGVRPKLGAAAPMRDGGVVMPPAGWLDFCSRNAGDPACQAAELTPDRAQQLQAVQAAMRALPDADDMKRFGKVDYWQVADARGGDCDDVALAARARLLALGWPRSALRLATVWTERNEFHLVLTVDVSLNGRLGTLVVDRRFASVLNWRQLQKAGYRFEARQAATGATWVRIEGGPAAPARVQMADAHVDRPALAAAAVPAIAFVAPPSIPAIETPSADARTLANVIAAARMIGFPLASGTDAEKLALTVPSPARLQS